MSKSLELHRKSTLINIHDHMFSESDFEDMAEGGFTAKFCHLAVDEKVFDTPAFFLDDDRTVRLLKALDHIFTLQEKSNGRIRFVNCAEDIRAAKREGGLALVLGSEGGGFLKGHVELLRVFYRLGLRFLVLTWAYPNELAMSQQEYLDGPGLTPAGRDVVLEMSRLGMILDLDHISRRAIDECFELYDKPMIYSHSNPRYDNRACFLDQGQMRKLADNRGIVGIHFCSHMIHDKYSGVFEKRALLSELVDSIDLAIEFGGEDCVALGCDFMPRTPYYFKFSTCEWVSFVEGIDNIRHMPLLTEAMVKRGYSDARIMKILGGNALRVIEEVLG